MTLIDYLLNNGFQKQGQNKFMYCKQELHMTTDEGEKLYKEEMFIVYKYELRNNYYYTITIIKSYPGIGSGNLNFDQRFEYNQEPTIEYINQLRSLFNI